MSDEFEEFDEDDLGEYGKIDLGPSWFDVGLLGIVIPLSLFVGVKRASRVFCYVYGHSWAYEDRYGVEPECLKCGFQPSE